MDPDAQTQSDSEDRPDAGWVQRIVGGVEYGLVFQQTAVTRMTYPGLPAVFAPRPTRARLLFQPQ